MDTANDNLTIINETNIQYPYIDELILDPYASLPWTRGFDNKSQQLYIYMQQQNSTTRFYYIFYKDFLSVNSKLDIVQQVKALGIAIFDIIRDAALMDFTFAPYCNLTSFTGSLTFPRFLIIGVISAFIVVSILVPVFLHLKSRKRRQRCLIHP
ncbi:hypothetical protein C2G38_2211187 [Gigaspora rosea]|uniref:Uncharacterized protein n=1 Tax=Gigaspora rosea TaxID=44941 RepID=A0A397UE98_9GLOM|nr:hypothetical protein C2G38_2211187 [Gigaspora rosea]